MSRKSNKGKIFTILVCCKKCGTKLYKYQKEGPGSLVKCFVNRIVEDFTNGDLKCPTCRQEFARKAVIHNRPAHKIIQGKVITKGHVKK